jgi:hypothetical protein
MLKVIIVNYNISLVNSYAYNTITLININIVADFLKKFWVPDINRQMLMKKDFNKHDICKSLCPAVDTLFSKINNGFDNDPFEKKFHHTYSFLLTLLYNSRFHYWPFSMTR